MKMNLRHLCRRICVGGPTCGRVVQQFPGEPRTSMFYWISLQVKCWQCPCCIRVGSRDVAPLRKEQPFFIDQTCFHFLGAFTLSADAFTQNHFGKAVTRPLGQFKNSMCFSFCKSMYVWALTCRISSPTEEGKFHHAQFTSSGHVPTSRIFHSVNGLFSYERDI